MKKVCNVCHSESYVNNFYVQYDGLINLYNEKFGSPGVKIMKLIYANNLITSQKFDEKIEWVWWEIWHHQGRRARHGVSMNAPDYTHWHGLYEVAKAWYIEFIPEIKEVISHNLNSSDHKKTKGAVIVKNELDKMLNSANHQWFIGKLSPEEKAKRKKAQQEFKARYAK